MRPWTQKEIMIVGAVIAIVLSILVSRIIIRVSEDSGLGEGYDRRFPTAVFGTPMPTYAAPFNTIRPTSRPTSPPPPSTPVPQPEEQLVNPTVDSGGLVPLDCSNPVDDAQRIACASLP